MSAEKVWEIHRAILGGRSSATGAELPQVLAAAPQGAQAAHYGIALACARDAGRSDPAPPPGLPRGDAERVREIVGPLVPVTPAARVGALVQHCLSAPTFAPGSMVGGSATEDRALERWREEVRAELAVARQTCAPGGDPFLDALLDLIEGRLRA